MPTINIFYNDSEIEPKLGEVTAELKQYVAQQLTCGDIHLNSDEVRLDF